MGLALYFPEWRRAQCLKALCKVLHLCCKLRSLCRRDPFGSQALLFNSTESKQLLEKTDSFICCVITIQVMTVPQVSPPYKDPVHTLLKSKQDMVRGYTCRTHDSHHPYVGRVLQPTDPSQVSSSVRSPRTEKAHNPGLKIGVTHKISLSRSSDLG